MHWLVLDGQVADDGHVIGDERRKRRAQHLVNSFGLGLNRTDELLGQRDVGLDHVTRGAADLANLIGHALQVKVDVDNRLQQAEDGGDRRLRGDQVVAHGLQVGAARVNRKRALLGLGGELAVVGHIGLHGIVEGQIDGLIDAQHLVTGLDELTGKQFAHGSLQSVGCGHAARTVNTHRTRSDRLGTSRTDQPKRPVI